MATQGVTLETLPNKVPLDFLKKITSNFSKELQLGEGAFGEVYKGILDSGELVAVKKLAENSPVPRETIFDNELQNIMVLEHENIVKLVAFCREAQNRLVQSNGRHIIAEIIETLLCYEYLPKGGLDKSLVGEFSSIEWDIRFKIIKGICQGWQHDTEDCRLWILQNIWPRTNPNEHTKCCGICVSFALIIIIYQIFEVLFIFTSAVMLINLFVIAISGYMAPEYLYNGEISARSDIYSLGLVILEISTREKNSSSTNQKHARKYIDEVTEKWKLETIMSEYELEEDELNQVEACIDSALKCVEIDQKNRPTIQDIVKKLSNL
ncbi:unnamed protein product [Triticum aestivum]|uniref:Protein kinase domain-containing protein n=2 Tax=Triticum aestivum TaxID=4565 RepID=A0A9R1EMF4_WHEAT|nr:hypothetical protein CFC21_026966 [Triticum aestivum]SPT15430.1 unnamed protein product [Triticum aestivum]